MAQSITVAAHAKINLILRVLDRDHSGYHHLETVFQRLALADTVAVSVAAGSSSLDVAWTGQRGDLGPVEQNLAWRAAVAYRASTGWPAHWGIEITKRIPVQGGLGGGSADAAAVLRALNALSASPLDQASLCRIGAALGADVPFLVTDQPLALGRGYGEQLEVLPALAPASVVLVVPPYGIRTADAYASLDRARAVWGPGASPRPVTRLAADTLADWASVAAQQHNDFEPTVFAAYPELGAIRAGMERSGAVVARLSGSGSAVFGVFASGGAFEMPVGAAAGMRVILTETV